MKFEVPKNRINRLRYIIEKIIMPKFPKLDSIEDIEYNLSSLGLERFFVNFITSECLDIEEQIEIYDNVKALFKASSLGISSDNHVSDIRTYFDCGNGEGFVFNGW